MGEAAISGFCLRGFDKSFLIVLDFPKTLGKINNWTLFPRKHKPHKRLSKKKTLDAEIKA
jgi:hypothetical protein